jgi:hypothetical protein
MATRNDKKARPDSVKDVWTDVETRRDKELEEFRDVMTVPTEFRDGFSWSSLLGAIFIALVMVPGSIYMGLLAGQQQIGSAAQWVTVILFIEVAKRAHRYLNRSEIFVLFFMAGAAMGMPFNGLLWNQFFARSDAASAYGIAELLPKWFAPAYNSEAYHLRSFFHVDWLPCILLTVFGTFSGQLNSMVLGYGLFRVTSDREKLPFPMAPVGAQGIMALAEDSETQKGKSSEDNWRWRVFSIGGALGLAFGSVYLLLPTLTSAFTGTPIQIFPIPFSDFTTKTQDWLPATATGMVWDLGNLIFGMVMPYFAMVGSFVGLIMTSIANPILHHYEILKHWQPGDDTVATMFKNNVDFYFSFQIGIAFALAIFGFIQVWRSFKRAKIERVRRMNEGMSVDFGGIPEGRGDIPTWAIMTVYFFLTTVYILLSGYMIDWHRGVMVILCFLGFLYTPLISYVTARLEGMVGEVVEIPYIREACIIFSGYTGVKCWFLPIPVANYGQMTVFYRQCELTGTRFTSIWKTQVILYPIILISSIFFMNFIWGLGEVPSPVYPYAQRMWDLSAANSCIMFTATLGEYSIFEQAFNFWYILVGAGFGLFLFGGLSAVGSPVFLMYGLVRGLGQSMPHVIIPQFIGALLGRYYFRKKFGDRWRQYIPVVAAGYGCGVGLVTTLGIGVTFLSKAVIQMPF